MNITDIERYGYDVIWMPEKQTYYISFDNHIFKEKMVRDWKVDQISSNFLEDRWYKSWIKSIVPSCNSYHYMHGLEYFEYEETDAPASITFKRTIPTESLKKIKIYTNDGLDVTPYFDYQFNTDVNTLTVVPNSSVVYNFPTDDLFYFNIYIEESFFDIKGKQLTRPLKHRFSLPELNGSTLSKDVGKEVILSERMTSKRYNFKELYKLDDKTLMPIERLGRAEWNQNELTMKIYNDDRTNNLDVCTYNINYTAHNLNAIYQVKANHYKNFISEVAVANRTAFKDNGYSLITSSDSDDLAVLASPIADENQIESHIKLIVLRSFSPSSSVSTPEINGIHIKKTFGTNDICALVLLEGLTLENGDVLDESIYFLTFIESN